MALLLLCVLALAVRIHIAQLPMNFHPTRQYRSTLIARAHYLEGREHVSTEKLEVARENRRRQGQLEPPVMELLACLAYFVAGDEHLWIPRLLSSIFWVIGGVMAGQARSSFIPRMFLMDVFWTGLLAKLDMVPGLFIIVVTLVGPAFARAGLPRPCLPVSGRATSFSVWRSTIMLPRTITIISY